jgi:hypothetical protein
MKKKIIFAVATGLFALATVFNMNVLQSNSAGDVSLESIAVMAQAQDGESGGGSNSDCNLCVVTNLGKIVFSCKREVGKTCISPKRMGTTVRCADAVACSN